MKIRTIRPFFAPDIELFEIEEPLTADDFEYVSELQVKRDATSFSGRVIVGVEAQIEMDVLEPLGDVQRQLIPSWHSRDPNVPFDGKFLIGSSSMYQGHWTRLKSERRRNEELDKLEAELRKEYTPETEKMVRHVQGRIEWIVKNHNKGRFYEIDQAISSIGFCHHLDKVLRPELAAALEDASADFELAKQRLQEIRQLVNGQRTNEFADQLTAFEAEHGPLPEEIHEHVVQLVSSGRAFRGSQIHFA